MKPTKIKLPLKNAWQQKWISLDVTHPKLQELANVAERFCGNWIKQNPAPGLLYVCGVTGTGKTHVSDAIGTFCRAASWKALKATQEARSSTLSVASWRWPALADEFRERNFSALPDLFTTDCVILDDVGAEDDPFKIAADKICQVLSRRENKFTVITSNKMPEEFAAIDPRIADRLFRNSAIVDLSGVTSYAELKLLNKV